MTRLHCNIPDLGFVSYTAAWAVYRHELVAVEVLDATLAGNKLSLTPDLVLLLQSNAIDQWSLWAAQDYYGTIDQNYKTQYNPYSTKLWS